MSSVCGPTQINRIHIGSIFWIAGILEGEGYFTSYQIKNKSRYHTTITVAMSDKDIIERLQKITGIGSIGIKKGRPGTKPMWYWTVARRMDILHLLCSVVPLMGERRRTQIVKLLDGCLSR